MNRFDDSDMKIVSAKSNSEKRADAEAGAEEFYALQKENGNLEKAQRLGAKLADLIDELELSDDGAVVPALGEIELNSERVLMIFSTVAGIETAMPNALVIRTALIAFYRMLKTDNPKLYDYMSSSGAFSFYYLEYRRGGELARNIASAFAMLCGRENDEALVHEGERIFEAYYAYTIKLAAEYEFAK